MSDKMWKCEQLRAGIVTNRVMFDTEKQASEFVSKMQELEPDLLWRVEPVDAWRVWN
jgi:hypothetical protein